MTDTDLEKNPWRVSTKTLTDIQTVLKTWLWSNIPTGYGENNFGMFDFGSDKNKITGRRLTYLSLLFLQHFKQVQLDDIKEIQRLSQLLGTKECRISELEAELRDYKYAKYTAIITYVSWSCGDGCCSDSWYEAMVFDENRVAVKEFGGQYTNDKPYLESEIRKQYGKNIKFNYNDREA